MDATPAHALRDWPNAAHSQFVRAAGLDWHVQIMGSGPTLLLLHGTGAATHSWRDLMPFLAEHFTLVVAPICPATASPRRPPPTACRFQAWRATPPSC